MYHVWGSNYAQAILKENRGRYCFQLNPFKKVSANKCGPLISSSNIMPGTSSKRQGWAKYGNCYIRGYGDNGNVKNYIYLYKNSRQLDSWAVPQWPGGEIEDVMSDGNGQIWYTFAVNGSSLTYHKMKTSTSQKWSQKCKATSVQKTDKKNTTSSKKDNSSGGGSNNSGNTTPSKTFTPSQSTYDGVAETIFFGNIKDDGSGCGIFMILNFIIEILTWGIGVAGVIGISISGIMYLTAKGNEAQTLKAKRRIYEIVIGLAAYAVIWAVTNWLLPGGVLNNSPTCATISNEDLQKQRAARQAETQKQQTTTQKTSSNDKSYNQCMKKASKEVRDKICKLKTQAERISETGRLLAWPAGTAKSKTAKSAPAIFTRAMKETKTNKGESGCRKSGKACGMYVGTVVRAAGIDPKFPKMASKIYPYVKKSKNWKQVSTSSPKPGDISLSHFSGGNAGHVSLYIKNKNGKTVTAQGSLCSFYGRISNSKQYTGSGNKTFRYIGP